jgi:hypothetical protein
MKKYFYFLIIICVFSLSISSCDDLLKPQIYSTFTDENFPSDESDIDGLVYGLYSYFGPGWGPIDPVDNNNKMWGMVHCINSWFNLSEAASDEMYDPWLVVAGITNFNWGTALDKQNYQACYSRVTMVASATSIIQTLKNNKILTDEKKQLAIAEVKCLRAWMMFYLYDFYGPVDVKYTEESLKGTSYNPRPTDKQFFDWIVKDLTEAIQYLPKTNNIGDDAKYWGRANRGLAEILLMKLYMNKHDWKNAQIYMKDLKTLGYSLQSNYNEIFTKEKNPEIIFACPTPKVTPASTQYDPYHIVCFLPRDAGSILGMNLSSYNIATWGGATMRWSFYNTFSGVDKRRQGIATSYIDKSGQTVKGDSTQTSPSQPGAFANGPIVVKWLPGGDRTAEHIMNRMYMVDYFRFSDVLLSEAEILNELNQGPTNEAIASLKMITDRAGTTDTPDAQKALSMACSYQDFKDFLLAERGRELYWSGLRRMDLIRFGKYQEVVKNLGGRDYSDRIIKFPIPPTILTGSGGVYVNNPGY